MIPEWVADDLASLEAGDSLRRLTPIEEVAGERVRVGGRERVNFSSNDYLGLAGDRRLAEASAAAARDWGAGAGASRLITGTLGIHTELEERLAAFKGTETALLFSTGYQANLGILTALGADGVIFSDELNHASIVDGCRLTRARVAVYRHADPDDLARRLSEHRDAPRKLVVTDGVFSMDGDLAPLPEVVELARKHRALVVVDDAHATGVVGGGRGTAHHFGLPEQVDLCMGTFGKALGSFGAFVACSGALRKLLVNRARSLIYTTAPPPAVAGAALAALEVMQEAPRLVKTLGDRTKQLRRGLRDLGYPVSDDPTPIVPVILGGNRRTVEWSRDLWEAGFWVHPIRPPTVPEGEARLRITVRADHAPEDIDGLLSAVSSLTSRDGGRP